MAWRSVRADAKHARNGNRNAGTELEQHVGATHFNEDIRTVLLQRPGPAGTKLFPDWKTAMVNKALVRVAADEQWDSSYKWTTHAIRYGSASDARAEEEIELQGQPDNYRAVLGRVQERIGQMDHTMSEWYSRDASARAQARAEPFERQQLRREVEAVRAAAAGEPRRRARPASSEAADDRGSAPVQFFSHGAP